MGGRTRRGRPCRGCGACGSIAATGGVALTRAHSSTIASAVGSAASAEEELWLAMRSMPAAAAALAAVRDGVDAAADEETRAHFERAREELVQTRVHRALTTANGQFRRRDGPLPVSIDACAILALMLCAIVGEEKLRKLLPRAASLLLDNAEPLLADGVGSAIAKDILCSRGVLAAEVARRGIKDAAKAAHKAPCMACRCE